MDHDENEEKLLRSVAFQNSRAVLLARERAEESLLKANLALEQKNIELAQQREWFQVTLSSIGDAVITADTQGNVTFLNPVAELLTGWKSMEAIGLPLTTIFNIINEQTRLPVENPISKVLSQGITVGLANHTSLISRDGSERSIEDSAAAIKSSNGTILGAVMVFHDVTGKKLEELALKEAAEQNRLAMEAGSLGSWDYRFESGQIFWDERCRNMWGISEGETIDYHSVMDRIHQEDRTRIDLAVQDALQGVSEGVYHVEFRVVWQDGTEHWIASHGKVHFRLENQRRIPVRFIGTAREITNEKKAAEAIRQSDAELRTLADAMPQLAWIAEPDGYIFWYNTKWYEYTGCSAEEMRGWGWKSVHNPEILPKVIEKWEQSILTGQSFEMEFPLRSRDGHFRWFLTRVNSMKNAEGKVIRWFGTNTDVHEEKNAQAALKEEAEILELLNKTGTSITGQLDLQTLMQTVTDVGTRISGAQFGAFFYTQNDEPGGAFLLYTLSGAPREAFEKFGHPRATPLFGLTFRGEGIVRSDDILKDPRYGNWGPHHGMPKGHLPVRSYLAVPVGSRSGEIIGGLFFGHPEVGVFTERSERLILGISNQAAIAIDNARLYEAAQKEIEERRKAEEQSKAAGKRFMFLAESMPQKIFTTTPDGRIEYLNRQWLEFTGKSFEALKNLGWLSAMHPDDLQASAELWKNALNKGIPFQGEHRFRDAAGHYRWHLTRAQPLRNEAGKVIIWVGSHTDIDELRQTQSELESAIRAKDEFLAILSHELRTPLTPVLMTISNLRQQTDLPSKVMEKLERIERNVLVEAHLIDDLLDLTRITQKKLDIHFEPFDLNECLKSSIEICHTELVQSKCVAIVDLTPKPLMVLGDAKRLQQVFWNLLKNAIKFSPGGGEIALKSHSNGGFAQILISDRGVGIEKSQLQQIFNPFEQGGRAGFGGLGLGLAICKASVEAHGGSIDAKSEGHQRGSTFEVNLPLMDLISLRAVEASIPTPPHPPGA